MQVPILPSPSLQLFSWTGGNFCLVFQVPWKLPGSSPLGGLLILTPAYLLLFECALNRRKMSFRARKWLSNVLPLCMSCAVRVIEDSKVPLPCISYSKSSGNSYSRVYVDFLLVTDNFMMSTLYWGWHFLLLSWKLCDEFVWVMLTFLGFSAVFYMVMKCFLHRVGLLSSPCSEGGLKFSF